jgi:hypothetical protein
MEKAQPLFVTRDRGRAWKGVVKTLLLTPVLVYLALYYFPFILWDGTFARWTLGGLIVAWLLFAALEIYDLIFGDDQLLVINDHGIWAKACGSKNTIPWDRLVDAIETPTPRASDGARDFKIVYRPDGAVADKNISFTLSSAWLNTHPDILRNALRSRLEARGLRLKR